MSSDLKFEDRKWATLCYLSAIIGYCIPFLNVVVPFIVWQMTKDKSAFIDIHGRESVNLQISFLVYLFVAVLLIIVYVGYLLVLLVILWQMAMVAMGAYHAYVGKDFRVSFILRLV